MRIPAKTIKKYFICRAKLYDENRNQNYTLILKFYNKIYFELQNNSVV